jgi:hypothetical protein
MMTTMKPNHGTPLDNNFRSLFRHASPPHLLAKECNDANAVLNASYGKVVNLTLIWMPNRMCVNLPKACDGDHDQHSYKVTPSS